MAVEEGTHTELIKDVVEPLYRAKFWMQLIGVILIISGVATALTIAGLLVAWIPIWAGVVLMQAAGAVDRAYARGEEREAVQTAQKLRVYFTIFGILFLVYIIFFGVMLMLGFGGMFAAMNAA